MYEVTDSRNDDADEGAARCGDTRAYTPISTVCSLDFNKPDGGLIMNQGIHGITMACALGFSMQLTGLGPAVPNHAVCVMHLPTTVILPAVQAEVTPSLYGPPDFEFTIEHV